MRAAQRKRTRPIHLPAPLGGLNTVAPATGMPLTDCVSCHNLIGGEYGLRSRLGYREWVTGLGAAVRSLLPFMGSTSAGNKLFAATSAGIWDCSTSTATPTQVVGGASGVAWGDTGADAGWCSCTAFTALDGAHWLLVCDEANGYYTYAESGGTWTKVAQGTGATQINGVDPAGFSAVTPWKNRLWFVQKSTQTAWYLGLGALYGTATAFRFGSRFKAGGDLRTLASWTMDGGDGIDDRLVAVSGAGDVVIYQGYDPAQASGFSLSGVWYVGGVPAGRRLASDFGGDLLVMSSTGILPLSRLVSGAMLGDSAQYQTAKVANLWARLQQDTRNTRGWAMRLHPVDSSMMVIVPASAGSSDPLVMSLNTKGWSRYRDLPIGSCAETWNGTLYFGTADGRVCAHDGYVDGVTLADPSAYTPIDWSLLTAFSAYGSPFQKRIQQIRVEVSSTTGAVDLNAEARFDMDLREASKPAVTAATGTNTWDSGLWDVAKWEGDLQPQRKLFGATGIGTEMAIAVRGSATSRMSLVSIDAEFSQGGFR